MTNSNSVGRHLLVITIVCLFGMDIVYGLVEAPIHALADISGSELIYSIGKALFYTDTTADIFWGVVMLVTAGALAAFLKWDGTLKQAMPVGIISLSMLRMTTLVFVLDNIFGRFCLWGLERISPSGEVDLLKPDYDVEITIGYLPADLFASAFAAPIAEEFLFRGALMSALLARGVGPVTTVAVSSFLFAITHSQYEWQGVLLIMISGCFLGFLRLYTGGLFWPVLCHAVMNMAVILFDYLPVVFGQGVA